MRNLRPICWASQARSVSQCTKYKATSLAPACNLIWGLHIEVFHFTTYQGIVFEYDENRRKPTKRRFSKGTCDLAGSPSGISWKWHQEGPGVRQRRWTRNPRVALSSSSRFLSFSPLLEPAIHDWSKGCTWFMKHQHESKVDPLDTTSNCKHTTTTTPHLIRRKMKESTDERNTFKH